MLSCRYLSPPGNSLLCVLYSAPIPIWVSDIALAFDASRIENPEMARLILENTCRRIIKRKVGCHKVLIQHLEHFGTLECLSAPQVTDFSERIKKLA
jgi:hypothetical protein